MADITSTEAVSARSNTGPTPQRPATRHDFQVAIMCALTIEADAVIALFDCGWDEDGFSYGRASGDHNAYSTGAIGRHNVVLVHMPAMGKVNAATTAASCRASFPNIKLAIVVGICGAVPFIANGDEVLLGDIIISEGIVQYDLGRRLPEQFVRKNTLLDSLGRPNSEIGALLSKLKGVQSRRTLQDKIADYLEVLHGKADIQAEYPGKQYDMLFEAAYRHIEDGRLCEECGCDGELVPRARLEQHTSQPLVHFGVIASGDTVMKSGEERDAIARQENVVAFEMEGAGVWDSFPCVVIKSACDYADSHKTKVWQQYAAATAASCTKAFLGHWLPSIPFTENQGTKASLYSKQKSLLKFLWPSRSKHEEYKDRNPQRLAGTCEWFITHPRFHHWQNQKESALLWVSADPGCGKSVLVRFLVDEVLRSTNGRTTCYFFFKDDFDDQKQITSAFRCILSQIFRQRPVLLSESVLADLEELEKLQEEKPVSFRDLWRILIKVTDTSQTEEIICILDALDECEEEGQSELVQVLDSFYSASSRRSCLKFIVTSRPYVRIQRKFQVLEDLQPTIHLSGENEEEAKSISREIDIVIQTRIESLGKTMRLSDDEKQVLLDELLATDHKTYLWVYLVFDAIERDGAIFTQGGMRENIHNLPKTVESAYDKILCKGLHADKAKKLLHIIIAASRALTLEEIALAFSITEEEKSYESLKKDLLPPDRLHLAIREACGLFVVIRESKVYLLHQTAREFLMKPLSRRHMVDAQSPLKWQHSLCPRESNRILSEVCIWYLLLEDFQSPLGHADNKIESQYTLLHYAADNWALHFRLAEKQCSQHTLSLALRLFDIGSQASMTWIEICQNLHISFPREYNALIIASYFGLEGIVEYLLKANRTKLFSRDKISNRSTHLWPNYIRQHSAIKLLLQKVPRSKVAPRRWSSRMPKIVQSKDKSHKASLYAAAKMGHTPVVQLLLDRGAKIEARGGIPLCTAAHMGYILHIQFRLDKSAYLKVQGDYKNTPLHAAALEGHILIIQLLLDKGANIEARGDYKKTPLYAAALGGHIPAIQLLLDKGANIEAQDSYKQTPLHTAAQLGYVLVTQLLLDKGANIEAQDKDKKTPLHRAAQLGYVLVIQLLLDKGANIEARDNYKDTPLHKAAQMGHMPVIQLLLDRGANIEAQDKSGRTPLKEATQMGHMPVVQLLLDRGAQY